MKNNANSDNESDDSSYNDSDNDSSMLGAIESIPSYHGPVCDALPTALKVLELECNCFEIASAGEKGGLDMTVMEMTAKTVLNACTILLDGCNARIGIQNTTAAAADASGSNNLTQVALEPSKK